MKKCGLLVIGFLLFATIGIFGAEVTNPIAAMSRTELESSLTENLDIDAPDTQEIIENYVRKFVMKFADLSNLSPDTKDWAKKSIIKKICQYMRPLILQNTIIQGANIPFHKGESRFYQGRKWFWSKVRWPMEEVNQSLGPFRYMLVRSSARNVVSQWYVDINPHIANISSAQTIYNQLRSILNVAVSPDEIYVVVAFVQGNETKFFIVDRFQQRRNISTIDPYVDGINRQHMFFIKNNIFVYGKQTYQFINNTLSAAEVLDDNVLFKSSSLEIQYSAEDKKIKIARKHIKQDKPAHAGLLIT